MVELNQCYTHNMNSEQEFDNEQEVEKILESENDQDERDSEELDACGD